MPNNLYTKLIRAAKKQYYDDKFTEYSKDMRKTWVTIREVIGTKKHRINIPDFFRNNGELITNCDEIAEGFNEFFSGIGPELAASITPGDKIYSDYLGTPVVDNFIFARVTPQIIFDLAGKLKGKNSAGQDKISSKLLKKILPIIINPLCHLFNLSFQTGYIPQQFKIAKVIPIYKSGDKHLFTNYRPISLLSNFSNSSISETNNVKH